MATVINATIRFKRGTADRWNEVNPVLMDGEPGYETNTGKVKIGNGVSAWKDLTYLGEKSVVNASTHYDFPSIGKVDVIYKAESEKKIYQWNPSMMKYEALDPDDDVLDVEIIHGGNANGTA